MRIVRIVLWLPLRKQARRLSARPWAGSARPTFRLLSRRFRLVCGLGERPVHRAIALLLSRPLWFVLSLPPHPGGSRLRIWLLALPNETCMSAGWKRLTPPRMKMRAPRVAPGHSQKRTHYCDRSNKTKVLRSSKGTERAYAARVFSEEPNEQWSPGNKQLVRWVRCARDAGPLSGIIHPGSMTQGSSKTRSLTIVEIS
jgi:hypothetical protein